DAVLYAQNRNVERAAPQVVHGDDAFVALIEAIGQGGCPRLVDDPQPFETGDSARVASGSTLRVVEVSRHGNDGPIHLRIDVTLTGKELLGAPFQLPKDKSRYFGWREFAIR